MRLEDLISKKGVVISDALKTATVSDPSDLANDRVGTRISFKKEAERKYLFGMDANSGGCGCCDCAGG